MPSGLAFWMRSLENFLKALKAVCKVQYLSLPSVSKERLFRVNLESIQLDTVELGGVG